MLTPFRGNHSTISTPHLEIISPLFPQNIWKSNHFHRETRRVDKSFLLNDHSVAFLLFLAGSSFVGSTTRRRRGIDGRIRKLTQGTFEIVGLDLYGRRWRTIIITYYSYSLVLSLRRRLFCEPWRPVQIRRRLGL